MALRDENTTWKKYENTKTPFVFGFVYEILLHSLQVNCVKLLLKNP